ncbi:hypothetical protein [Halorussus aquaticus]|uniref:Uncharacterized protein n=1 Tax=Halorussus aquaticus TaxID=2953748 RepID=A0ABD5Q505_9EURY|nr:hypothetical protein [Halorussus aquaticus]
MDTVEDLHRFDRSLIDVAEVKRVNGHEITAETVRTHGPGGKVGKWVYLGKAEVRWVTADGQRVPVIRPEGVDPSTPPAHVASAINQTARLRGLPETPDTLTVWYDDQIEGRAVGTGGYDTIRLQANATNETVRHEYVHIAQIVEGTNSTTWFIEGSAEYLAHLAAMQQTRADFDAYYDRISLASANATHTLTATDGEHYTVGEQVVAALDLRIRESTSGNASVIDVIRYLNQHEKRLAPGDVYTAVKKIAGPSDARWLQHVVEDGVVPAIPERSKVQSTLIRSRPGADFDQDGLSSSEEISNGTDSFSKDTDDDGLSDEAEVTGDLDPTASDTDGDGANDDLDSHPAQSTLSGTVKSAGVLIATVSIFSIYVTVIVVILRLIDRVLGIVPDRIVSISLKRITMVTVAVVLLGCIVYAVGIFLA